MSALSGENEDDEDGSKKDGLGVPQLFVDTGNPSESQAEETLAKGILPSVEEVKELRSGMRNWASFNIATYLYLLITLVCCFCYVLPVVSSLTQTSLIVFREAVLCQLRKSALLLESFQGSLQYVIFVNSEIGNSQDLLNIFRLWKDLTWPWETGVGGEGLGKGCRGYCMETSFQPLHCRLPQVSLHRCYSYFYSTILSTVILTNCTRAFFLVEFNDTAVISTRFRFWMA